MKYYHIQRLDNERPEWNFGDKYLIDNSKKNWFNQHIIRDLGDIRTTNNNDKFRLVKYVQEHLFEHIEKSYSDTQLSYKNSLLENEVRGLKDSLKQYLKWIQEDIFENVRKNNFPLLPSRQHCIWVSSLEHLNKWWSMFSPKDNRYRQAPRKILELDLEGQFHEADATLIDSDTYKISEFEARAKRYWSGEIKSKKEVEILFTGKVKVLKEFKDINEIINNT